MREASSRTRSRPLAGGWPRSSTRSSSTSRSSRPTAIATRPRCRARAARPRSGAITRATATTVPATTVIMPAVLVSERPNQRGTVMALRWPPTAQIRPPLAEQQQRPEAAGKQPCHHPPERSGVRSRSAANLGPAARPPTSVRQTGTRNDLSRVAMLLHDLDGDSDSSRQLHVRSLTLLDSILRSVFEPLCRNAYYLPADRTGVMHSHHAVVGPSCRVLRQWD